MNPNQPNYPVDYLSQIAPHSPKPSGLGGLSRLQLIIIAAFAVIILLTVILSVILTSSHNVQPAKQLAARLQSTEIIVSNAQSKLQSTQLRALNSNLKSYLTNSNRDLAVALAEEGINVAKLDKNLVASEAGTAITNRLEDARLNARYDRIYANEITFQLETIVALIHQVSGSTSNKNLKNVLNNADNSLSQTEKQFAKFNNANS